MTDKEMFFVLGWRNNEAKLKPNGPYASIEEILAEMPEQEEKPTPRGQWCAVDRDLYKGVTY